MSGFIQGEDRFQATLFPERLDDYVAEDSAVRVIDVFLDGLDLSGLGFKTQPNDTGRPAYHPSTMLKLFVYGYLNRVQSSRRLEIEAQRNVELMWLTGRLAPDFKTIADFRKDNGEAICLVCREFVMLCRKFKLFANAFVAIDGSKFKAVNSRDRNFTRAKMKRRLAEVEASIDRYLEQLAIADQAEPAEDKTRRLEDKIAAMRKEMARLKKLEARMLNAPDKQVSLTDPDARSPPATYEGPRKRAFSLNCSARFWQEAVSVFNALCERPRRTGLHALIKCQSRNRRDALVPGYSIQSSGLAIQAATQPSPLSRSNASPFTPPS